MHVATFFFFTVNGSKKTNNEYNFFKYCITKNCKLKTKLKKKYSKFSKK